MHMAHWISLCSALSGGTTWKSGSSSSSSVSRLTGCSCRLELRRSTGRGPLRRLGYLFPSSCSFNTAITTITLLFVLINTVVGMMGKYVPHGSIFTSALVTCYCTYLGYGALSSMKWDDENSECNPLDESQNTFQMVLNIVFAGGALFMTGWGAGMYHQGKGGLGGKQEVGPGGVTAGVSAATSAAGVPPADEGPIKNDQVTVDINADENELTPASFWRYHLIMTLCSIYMAMLLTNWGDSEDADVTTRYNLGVASAWVQVAMNWMCSIIYLWTLIVPYMLRDSRDFGIQFDL